MPIEHTIHKAGGDNGEYYTFTVFFKTQRMSQEKVGALKKEADTLFRNQKVDTSVDRKIDLIGRSNQTVAIFHYTGNIHSRNHSAKKHTEQDFDQICAHVAALLELYDSSEDA